MVPAIEETMGELIKNVSAVKSMVDASRQISMKVEQSLTLAQNSIDGLSEQLSIVAANSADMAWLGSEMYAKIREMSNDLEEITQEYKKGAVSLKSLARLTSNRALANLKHAGAVWDLMSLNSREGADQFIFRFTVLLVSRDTSVLKTTSFRMWTGWPDRHKFVRYSGPEYVLHNHTANCTLGSSLFKS